MLERKATDPMQFWTEPADAYVVTTNVQVNNRGDNVMGGGIAKQAAQLVPELPGWYGRWLRDRASMGHSKLQIMGFGTEYGTVVLAPTKVHWRNPSTLPLVLYSCAQLAEHADKQQWQRVHLPQPGCGLGGLQWDEVKPKLEPLLDDRFVVWSL